MRTAAAEMAQALALADDGQFILAIRLDITDPSSALAGTKTTTYFTQVNDKFWTIAITGSGNDGIIQVITESVTTSISKLVLTAKMLGATVALCVGTQYTGSLVPTRISDWVTKNNVEVPKSPYWIPNWGSESDL